MKTLKKLMAVAGIICIAVSLPISIVSGQVLWSDFLGGPSVRVELLKPKMLWDDYYGYEYDITTGAVFLEYTLPLSEHISFLGNFSWAHAGLKNPNTLFGSQSEGCLGNPYAGFLTFNNPRTLSAEIGFWVPIRSNCCNSAAEIGMLSGFVENTGSFTCDNIVMRCLVTFHNYDLSGTVLSIRGGPLFVSGEEESKDLFLCYGVQAGLGGEKLSLSGSIDGLILLTDSELNFNERNVPEFKLAVGYQLKGIQPGVKIIAPLDKDYIGRMVNYTYAFSLNWSPAQN